GAAVEEVEYRIAFRRIEIARLEQAVVQGLAIAGEEAAELRFRSATQMTPERMARVEAVLLDPCDSLAVGIVQADLRRGLRVRERVDVEACVGGELGLVGAVTLADAQRRIGHAAVEREPMDLAVGGELAVRFDIDGTGSLVDR